MRRRLGLSVALALALGACSEEQAESLPPTNGFYFPMGLATTPLAGGGTAVLVASTNFDLRYSGDDGGTLVSVARTLVGSEWRWTWAGDRRTASYLGPVAVADGVTCPSLVATRSPAALVASRYDDRIYRFAIGDSGSLDLPVLGPSALEAPGGFDDPFAVTVACNATRAQAFVAYLDPPDSSLGSGAGAWIGEIDLRKGKWRRHVELGDGPVRAMAYDGINDRLWATTQSKGERALLHTVNLSSDPWNDGPDPRAAVTTFDLFGADTRLRGAELRAIAVGTAPAVGTSRLFITARLYDVEAQASLGHRPTGDVGGVLIVLDVVEGATPADPPRYAIRRIEDIGIGIAEVAVVKVGVDQDVAVISSRDQRRIFVYDDAIRMAREVTGEDANGAPETGDRPIGLAVDQVGVGAPWVYVASFGDHVVRRFHLDTGFPYAHAILEEVHP